MAVLLAAPAAPPAPAAPTPGRPSAPPEVAALLRSLRLESPLGSVDLLHDWALLPGYEGLDDPDAEPDLIRLPGRDGAVLRDLDGQRGVTLAERNIVLRCRVGSLPTPGAVSDEVQRVKELMNPRLWPRDAGGLRLVGTRYDGTVRWGDCAWVPLAGDFRAPNLWQVHRSVTLRLLCPDPLFRSEAKPITWHMPAAVPPMLPFFPLRIGSSKVVGTANPVTVVGDDLAWPVTRVWGPASSITASNGDGEVVTVVPPAPIAAGGLVTVRHDPATGEVDDFDTIEGPDGTSWYRYMLPGTRPWGLRPGVNQVTVAVPGATVETQAQLAYDHRHRSML